MASADLEPRRILRPGGNISPKSPIMAAPPSPRKASSSASNSPTSSSTISSTVSGAVSSGASSSKKLPSAATSSSPSSSSSPPSTRAGSSHGSPRVRPPRPPAMSPLKPLLLPPSSEGDGDPSSSSDFIAEKPSLLRKKIPGNISLTRSSSDIYTRAHPPRPKPRFSKSQSLNESSLSALSAKKPSALEIYNQRKLKIAEYGRLNKQGNAPRTSPAKDAKNSPPPLSLVPLSLSIPDNKPRCKFITQQTDPVYVAYHDKEWGVPVHDDRLLFELLVLAGALAELSWCTILKKRDIYRAAFAQFDAAAIARFNDKYIAALEADPNLSMHKGKICGIVESAQRIVEIVEEFGSLDAYLWSFMNGKPMDNNYRYPKQIPAKTSKSETVSKDLVRRGFRFVGPTIMYSFMQASGMTNDHLVQCFRHSECAQPVISEVRGDCIEGEKQDCIASGTTNDHLVECFRRSECAQPVISEEVGGGDCIEGEKQDCIANDEGDAL